MDRSLLRSLWKCADTHYLEYAIYRARLTKPEKEMLEHVLDECLTQEQAAETMDISIRKAQDLWKNAADKLLKIPWVYEYAKALNSEG